MVPEADVDSSRAHRSLFRAVPSSPRYRLRRLQRSFTIHYIPPASLISIGCSLERSLAALKGLGAPSKRFACACQTGICEDGTFLG
jgi:hypothetical protein